MHKYSAYLTTLIVAAGLTTTVALADSARAQCGFAATADVAPAETAHCTFSQRQGYIRISIDGEVELDLSPTGDTPGNFVDTNRQPVYRRSGLGDKGLIFQLPDRLLYVYWAQDTASSTSH